MKHVLNRMIYDHWKIPLQKVKPNKFHCLFFSFHKNNLPVEFGECCEPLEADLGAALPGGLPPVDLGLPGGRLSATDIKAAIGLCPEPGATPPCWPDTEPEAEPAAPLPSGGEPVLLLANGDVEELEPLAVATEICVMIMICI